MKSISLSIITLFISTYASAGNYNYNDYYLVGGSFGFDTLTDRVVPYQNSHEMAAAVFAALDEAATLNGGYKKGAGVASDDEILGLTCESSQCGVYAVLHKNDIVSTGTDQVYNFRFPKVISMSVYETLTKSIETPRMGATTRQAANVSCSKVVHPSHPYSCTVTGVYTMIPPMPLQYLIDQNPDEPTKEQYRQLLNQTLQSIGY
ncbi:MAG: hypothetical protein KDD61_07155 [Bdellovibrionales bacterium]|nr:hypothetical protein [Bdellovibrionales bacterium]